MGQLTTGRLHTSSSAIPSGEIEGEAILREHTGGVGLALARVYRSVMLWATEIPSQRADFFTDGSMAALAAEIAESPQEAGNMVRDALVLITCELGAEDPDLGRLSLTLLKVSDWAIQRRTSATALAFADAAASVAPSARFALIAGRLHRHMGFQHRAEHWLRHASALAGRGSDWPAKVWSVLSLGSACLAIGRYRLAEDCYRQAWRIAARYQLRELAGEVWHDLFVAAIVRNARKAADTALPRAASGYPHGHHRLPALGHDVAAYWIELNDHESARLVLLPLLDRYWSDDPTVRLLACGTTLRALGGCDRAEEFHDAYAEFRRLADTVGETPRLAPALLSAARGAISLREWVAAESLLSSAAGEARKTGQEDAELSAEECLRQVSERREERRPVNARADRPRTEGQTVDWLKRIL